MSLRCRRLVPPLLGVSKHAAQHEQQNNDDQLAPEDDAVHVDGRLPTHIASHDHVRTSWLGGKSEPATRSGPTSFTVGRAALAASATGATTNRRRRDHGYAVAFVRIAEHSLDGECVTGLLHNFVRVHHRPPRISDKHVLQGYHAPQRVSLLSTAEESVCSEIHRDRWFDIRGPIGQPGPVLEVPSTRYARCDGVHLAYQVVGDGPVDVLWMPHWATHVELLWEDVRTATFVEALSRFARVVLFDRRGTGLSDPVPLSSLPTMETWVEDLVAVLDAAGSRQCVVAASDLAATTAILFAAIHPDRTRALILVNATARARRADDYPAGVPDHFVEPYLASIEQGWGSEVGPIDVMDPSVADDDQHRRWQARYQRATASPGTIAAMARMLIDTDVRAALPAIAAPTLVVHRADDRYLRVDHGRYLAEHIPNATLVELPGADHSPEVGDTRGVLEAMARFVTGHETRLVLDRVLRTVVFTDIVGSTSMAATVGDDKWLDLLQRHHEVTRRQLARFGGTEIKSTGDGLLATFEGPARAIRCTLSTCDAVTSLGLSIRAGIHAGEIEYVSSDIVGIGVHLAARVVDVAAPGEVLVTRTVTELVAGSGIVFEDRGTHSLKGIADRIPLFAAISA